MEKRTLNIFGKELTYYNDEPWKIEKSIKVLKEICKKICEPQILSYYGLETVNLHILSDDYCFSNACIWWIYKNMKEATGISDDIRGCLLACSVEDEEWTRSRNEGMTDIFHRKIRFNESVQDMVRKEAESYISELSAMHKKISEEIEKKEKIKRELFETWEETTVYKDIKPYGGEVGRDGYHDSDFKSAKTDKIIRMVQKDIFDFGCFWYPKRLEGGDPLNRESWTEEEIELSKWIYEFGCFHGIRV